jgi:hypothetical protein
MEGEEPEQIQVAVREGLVWQNVTILSPAGSKGDLKVKCNFCSFGSEKGASAGASRLRSHFLGLTHQGVAVCKPTKEHKKDLEELVKKLKEEDAAQVNMRARSCTCSKQEPLACLLALTLLQVSDEQWEEYVSNSGRHSAAANKVQASVMAVSQHSMWAKAAQLVSMMQPIFVALRAFDAGSPFASKVFMLMHRLTAQLAALPALPAAVKMSCMQACRSHAFHAFCSRFPRLGSLARPRFRFRFRLRLGLRLRLR